MTVFFDDATRAEAALNRAAGATNACALCAEGKGMNRWEGGQEASEKTGLSTDKDTHNPPSTELLLLLISHPTTSSAGPDTPVSVCLRPGCTAPGECFEGVSFRLHCFFPLQPPQTHLSKGRQHKGRHEQHYSTHPLLLPVWFSGRGPVI